MEWNDVFAGYVVKDGENYVGSDDERFRVALISMAHRFTKSEAITYIEKNKPVFSKTFRVEPA